MACDSDDDNKDSGQDGNTKVAEFYLHYTLPDQKTYEENGGTAANEAAALFSSYTLTTGITYDSEGTKISGYDLEQFVVKDTVNTATIDPENKFDSTNDDARKLYSYVILSNNDGFDNRTTFEQILQCRPELGPVCRRIPA